MGISRAWGAKAANVMRRSIITVMTAVCSDRARNPKPISSLNSMNYANFGSMNSRKRERKKNGLSKAPSVVSSTDYVEHCWPAYSDFGGSVYIDFYYIDEKDISYRGEKKSRPDQKINGHIYLRRQCVPDIRPFTPPTHTSLNRYRLQSEDGDEIMLQDYCKLSISRKLVFMYSDFRPSASTPKFFEFVGIRRDFERERERERRSELNHPEGSY
jgi:hypothetical protein